jgi:transcriptional regulator with XRE-family HTH domain
LADTRHLGHGHDVHSATIRRVRLIKEYNQEYMAERLGLATAKTYCRYETGETKLDIPHLEQISSVFDMSALDLLSLDEKLFFNHCTQPMALGPNNVYHGLAEQEREGWTQRVKHLEEEVLYLREQLKAALERKG